MAAMTSTASFAVGIVSPAGVQSAGKAIVRSSTLTTPMMRAVTVRASRRRTGVRAMDAAVGGGGEERGKLLSANQRPSNSFSVPVIQSLVFKMAGAILFQRQRKGCCEEDQTRGGSLGQINQNPV